VGQDTSRNPVDSVNWDDAMGFCRRLSAMPAEVAARRVYRLPREAEWEYACRAGTTTHWYCGDNEMDLNWCAWVTMNSANMTHPVGQKRPNSWGLYDMSGNVEQWCADWFSTDYTTQAPPGDHLGPPGSQSPVMRGGDWQDNSFYCRSAFRYNPSPATDHRHIYGFRVAVAISAEDENAEAEAPGAAENRNAR
jgi:formylglycine-generating enzyme required for sulfatase activity